MSKEFYYKWEWHLSSTPEQLWALIADTNKFNHDTDVPEIEQLDTSELHNARRKLRLYRFGIPVEWIEEPFEWIRPFRFGVVRRYASGPVAEMRVLAELTPESTGTFLSYEVWAIPKNILGYAAIPFQIGFISAKKFESIFRKYDTAAHQKKLFFDTHFFSTPVTFVPGGKERMSNLQQSIVKQGADLQIVNHLIEIISASDDLTLSRIRPYALADYWSVSRRKTLETFLIATREGLLDFRWDLLCPLCRGAKFTANSLSKIQSQVHCDSCHIDFTVNFDRSVELTFRPNSSIRKIDAAEFCIAGPQVTPHVTIQQLLPAKTERKVNPLLEKGRYRLRTLQLDGGTFAVVNDEGMREVIFSATLNGWNNEEIAFHPKATIVFRNETSQEQLFIFERMEWNDQAATAADVTSLQLFRDLFANEALRPGEQISVGSLAILFTDLRGSTKMYKEIGDAPAFGRVMQHFDVLKEAIANEEGAIIKTMGDAVMAVFKRPANAMRAVIEAQIALKKKSISTVPLILKAGIHFGPSIAVNLNDKLDYFGSTINLAARLVDASQGNDILISRNVFNDPEVKELLRKQSCTTQELFINLKGFGAEEFQLQRIEMDK